MKIKKTLPASTLRHLIIFFIGCIIVLAGAFYVTGRNSNPYPEPINLAKMGPDRFLVTNRIPFRVLNNIKLRHLLSFGPPRVGLFGNHQLWYFTADAMGLTTGEGFMNLYADHIGLPEVRDELLFLEANKSLPSKLILVAIHNPHSTSGYQSNMYVLEMPKRMYEYSPSRSSNPSLFSEYPIAEIRNRLDWRNVLYNLFGDSFFGCRPPYGTQPKATVAPGFNEKDRWWRDVITALGITDNANQFRLATDLCRRLEGIAADGSYAHQGVTLSPVPEAETGPWTMGVPYINGQVERFLESFRDIDSIARRNGTSAVFFVPPVFEEDRDSSHNRELTAVLNQVQGKVTVLDHRRIAKTSEMFSEVKGIQMNNMHPSSVYVEFLAAELKRMGFMADQEKPSQ